MCFHLTVQRRSHHAAMDIHWDRGAYAAADEKLLLSGGQNVYATKMGRLQLQIGARGVQGGREDWPFQLSCVHCLQVLRTPLLAQSSCVLVQSICCRWPVHIGTRSSLHFVQGQHRGSTKRRRSKSCSAPTTA